MLYLSNAPLSDVIKQNGSELTNTDFEIEPIKRKNSLSSIVLWNLQLFVSPVLANLFSWGFLLNVALKIHKATI